MTTALHSASPRVSVNALAAPRVAALVAAAPQLRLGVTLSEQGATIVDAGIAARGGLEAGRRIAEICMGGLGSVALAPGEGKGAFQALASGPGRAIARRETLFEELGYADRSDRAAFVLEVDRVPPEPVIAKIARDCALAADRITIVLTPTRSLAGTVQVVARTLEVALHKAHALGFALERIVDGTGAAPLPPPAPDFLAAMGRTNDAILFAGRVTLYVDAADADAARLAETLPASASRDYGKPFAQVFKDYQFDFYKIDPMLFAPAEVTVCNLASGKSFRGGKRDLARLAESFGI